MKQIMLSMLSAMVLSACGGDAGPDEAWDFVDQNHFDYLDVFWTDDGNGDLVKASDGGAQDEGMVQDAGITPEDTHDPGFEVPAFCPIPVIIIEEGDGAPPQTILHLHGDQSVVATGAISKYLWSVDQPEENKFALLPAMNFPNPTHEVNVAGKYVYCLDVCDEQFCSSDPQCNTTACRKVVVVPEKTIHCELTWDTPADPDQFDEGPGMGSDMDLHFAHPFANQPDIDKDGKPDPWFDQQYDCFWFNQHPFVDSDNPNVDDDPSLDRDDTDGAGPENVNLGEPVDGHIYRIGVHYWEDNGYGPSYPVVKCWIFGQKVLEKNLKVLGVPMNVCDMWDVAMLKWDSGQVTPIQDPQGGPKITPCYQNPAFAAMAGDTCGCR